jgi:hypothetical protein
LIELGRRLKNLNSLYNFQKQHNPSTSYQKVVVILVHWHKDYQAIERGHHKHEDTEANNHEKPGKIKLASKND